MQALQTARIAAPAKVQVTRRQQVVVCATAQQQEAVPRRAALGLLAAAVLGLSAGAAEATGNAKNGSRAGADGYILEGTKKQGVSPKRKRQVLDKVRKAAGKQ